MKETSWGLNEHTAQIAEKAASRGCDFLLATGATGAMGAMGEHVTTACGMLKAYRALKGIKGVSKAPAPAPKRRQLRRRGK
jgi:hypothetical protein